MHRKQPCEVGWTKRENWPKIAQLAVITKAVLELSVSCFSAYALTTKPNWLFYYYYLNYLYWFVQLVIGQERSPSFYEEEP